MSVVDHCDTDHGRIQFETNKKHTMLLKITAVILGSAAVMLELFI